jgi:hypothetical protein
MFFMDRGYGLNLRRKISNLIRTRPAHFCQDDPLINDSPFIDHRSSISCTLLKPAFCFVTLTQWPIAFCVHFPSTRSW